MSTSLAIILPVHNREGELAGQVQNVLDQASDLTDELSVLIVDDGSTDDTFETAGDLAARFPQVSVVRLATQRGLGPAIESIRQRVAADVVMVHDGVSPLDFAQVDRLWREQSTAGSSARQSDDPTRETLSDLAGIATLNRNLVRAHQRLTGFHLISSPTGEEPASTRLPLERTDARSDLPITPAHMGTIPPVPQPKIRDVISHFALGE